MEKPIRLAFSPCPNDTFIFDALVNGKIDTEGLRFDVHIADVETLNQAATDNKFDITKLSFGAFYHVTGPYTCFNSGAAFCDDFGPVLLAKKFYAKENYKNLKVAVPGMFTTAALLYKHFFEAAAFVPMLFTDIEAAVLKGEADMGVVIHENVFTFSDKGLLLLENLGKLWTHTCKLPVPLGCIAGQTEIGHETLTKIDNLIRKSIEFAYKNPDSSVDFVRKHAPSTPTAIIEKHIQTYVNHYSIDMGNAGRNAAETLYEKAFVQKYKTGNKGLLFLNAGK